MKDNDIQRLKCAEMRMVRWMCGALLTVRTGGVRVVCGYPHGWMLGFVRISAYVEIGL